jgi:hypothetical protein
MGIVGFRAGNATMNQPTAKTPAQRQASMKARRIADGLVHWKRWVHPDDVPHLVALADKLARKRAKASI